MGAVVGSLPSGPVLWAGSGRSPETRVRAERAGLEDCGSVEAMVDRADVILSICPPDAATTVAEDVARAGFTGVYVDANAVSPATARQVGAHFETFVDGGIVGPPPTAPGLTRLYLAGSSAQTVASLFASTPLEVRVVDGGPGAASAVKMCFAAWTKGTSALLLAIRALAVAEGVDDDLVGEWATSMPDLVGRSERAPAAVGPKAWRFEGEMLEIADTFTEAGLPDGFHRAAAEVYHRLASLKDVPDPDLAATAQLLGAASNERTAT